MAVLPAVGLAALLGGTGLNIFQGRSASKKQSEFQKEQEKQAAEERRLQERERRQSALQRAVGSQVITKPRDLPDILKAPDLTNQQTLGALGQVLAQLGGQALFSGSGGEFGSPGRGGAAKPPPPPTQASGGAHA